MENEALTAKKSEFRDVFAVYKGKDRAEYLERIAAWYGRTHLQSGWGIRNARHHIEDVFRRAKECDDRRILMVIAKMSPRAFRIAKALKSRNYKVQILFYHERAFRASRFQGMTEISESYRVCECAEELMYEAACSKAKVIHCFTGMDSDIAAVLIQGRELFPPVIHDKYDIVCGMYNDIKRKALFDTDRYCLENAEALCCRGYEQEYLMDEAGFQINGRVLQFFDYCDGSFSEAKSASKGELSLCYAGNLVTEKTHPGSALACTLEFAALCERNKCCFHVYPDQWDTELYADYINLEKINRYFHIHEPVPFERLSEELSQYDYEVIPIKKSFLEHENDCFVSRNKYQYAATNKFFDALEAGLPVIAATPVKLAECLEQTGSLLRWCLEDFDFTLLRRLKEQGEIYKKVEKARKEFSIDAHIDELIRFYDSFD